MNRKLKLEELGRIDNDQFKNSSKVPLIIVLDDIRSLNNIGSIFRTADAFRLEAIYLCGFTACPPHRDIHKTALGATDSVHWEYYNKTEEAVSSLQKKGYQLCAVEQTKKAVSLQNFKPAERVAVILGNEVDGVQQEIVNRCDVCIEVPQFGTKHSLNVSVCAGIVIWELTKLLGFPES